MGDLLLGELSVSALTSLIKKTLEEGFYGLKVTGEVSNFRPSSTGHWFFTLKDEGASIGAVMFKSAAWRADFTPKEGDRVIVVGSLDVYPPRGTYQLKCDSIELAGFGEILAELERRKQLFAQRGYFGTEKKRAIPRLPKRVGVVTSASGAALQDILNVLQRRAPALDVLILPAVVQGEKSAVSVANRIDQANALMLCDLLIVARGGGSIEDLLPFSDEAVVQAIVRSEIPIITGIGHEIDFALADFASDLRAPTPSAAAEIASQGYVQIREQITGFTQSLHRVMESRIALLAAQVGRYDRSALNHRILALIEGRRYRQVNASFALTAAWERILRLAENRLDAGQAQLQALSPLAILSRGYAVVTDSDGVPITSVDHAPVGRRVHLRFKDGRRSAVVEE
jgi:exodeoxyribonuclease VII large subunit